MSPGVQILCFVLVALCLSVCFIYCIMNALGSEGLGSDDNYRQEQNDPEAIRQQRNQFLGNRQSPNLQPSQGQIGETTQ